MLFSNIEIGQIKYVETRTVDRWWHKRRDEIIIHYVGNRKPKKMKFLQVTKKSHHGSGLDSYVRTEWFHSDAYLSTINELHDRIK